MRSRAAAAPGRRRGTAAPAPTARSATNRAAAPAPAPRESARAPVGHHLGVEALGPGRAVVGEHHRVEEAQLVDARADGAARLHGGAELDLLVGRALEALGR